MLYVYTISYIFIEELQLFLFYIISSIYFTLDL